MFFEMLFQIVLSFIAGAMAVCVLAGYLVLSGELIIESTAKRKERKERKAKRKEEKAKLKEMLKKAEEKTEKKDES